MVDDKIKRPLQAVALTYGGGASAPRVVAQGYGLVAERIIAEAGRHGVYVHNSPELVGLLMQVDLDEQIPSALYQVIAELLVWIREIDAGVAAQDAGQPIP